MGKVGKTALILMMCLAIGSAAAEGFEFSFNGIRLNGALLGFLPVPTGADLGVRVPLAPGLLFSLRVAGGYEDRMILRNDSDGAPIAEPTALGKTWFNWPNLQLDTGLLYRPGDNRDAKTPGLELFLLARGRYENNSSGFSTAVFSDAGGLATVSFLAGAGIDAVKTDAARVKRGFAGELSVEYAPSLLTFSGGADFHRASGYLEGYLPLASNGEAGNKAVSLYAAGYLTADYAGGSNIPLHVLTSFGGRLPRNGLGSSIRGYQAWGYEASTKAEASLELRAVGPAFFGQPWLRPIAYVFGDAGYYGGLYKAPAPFSGADGIILSTGAGFAVDLLDFAYVGLRAGFRLPVDDPLYATYFGSGSFFWNIAFLLHF
jgi:hypothetical protein